MVDCAPVKRSKPEQDHTTPRLEAWREELRLWPIGRVRSPYRERFGTPRQPVVTEQVNGDRAREGRIELLPGGDWKAALAGLEGFSRIWVLYVFHLNDGFRTEIRPTRGPTDSVGVFASRSPHRPNPIGLSCLELVGIEGTTLHVRGLDILDGSPVLDIKPYVPYADAFPGASAGWLEGLDPAGPDRFEEVAS